VSRGGHRVVEHYADRKARLSGQAPKARRPTLTQPASCHPAARVIFVLMKRGGVTYDTLAEKSGVLRSTVKAWRHSNSPSWDCLNAVANVLGHELVVAPKLETLDPALRRDLEALAEKHGAQIEHLAAHLVETRALNIVTTEDGRRRVERWRERFDSAAESRRAGLTVRDARIAKARAA